MAPAVMQKSKHPQTKVRYIDGEIIEVDSDLAYLLVKMWSVGIETNFSCQGDPKFVDQTDVEARRYLAYIQMKRTDVSLQFIADLFREFYAFDAEKVFWEITFCRNPSTDENRITIRFPHMDIEHLEAFVEEMI